MPSEHFDYFFDRLQTTSHRVVGPCVKETFSRTHVVIRPELGKRFLDAPGSTGLEIELIQRAERNRFGTAPIRKQEHSNLSKAGTSPLTGSKYAWLKNYADGRSAEAVSFRALNQLNLKTSRAWRIKETFTQFWSYYY